MKKEKFFIEKSLNMQQVDSCEMCESLTKNYVNVYWEPIEFQPESYARYLKICEKCAKKIYEATKNIP